MVKEEIVQGMRVDTFLVDSDAESEESLQEFLTKVEEEQICNELLELLNQKNRLPD